VQKEFREKRKIPEMHEAERAPAGSAWKILGL
jgi:hypothetical protein